MEETRTLRSRMCHGAALAIAVAVLSLVVAAPATAAGPIARIPDAAMLQPEDLAGVPTSPAAEGLWQWLRPPEPCAAFRSGAKRGAERAIQAVYPVGETQPTVLMEHVAVYRGGGAQQYLRELYRAVSRFRGCVDEGRTWRVAGTGVAGRGSMLLSVSETIEYGDGSSRVKTVHVVVARVGRAVVVLADLGWEAGDGHEFLVRELATVAVRRAAVVR